MLNVDESRPVQKVFFCYISKKNKKLGFVIYIFENYDIIDLYVFSEEK